MEAQAPEENAAAAAVDAVTQMTNRFSAINTDDADAGPLKLDDVDGNVYSCKHCRTHLAVADDIISKVRRHVLSLISLAATSRTYDRTRNS